MNVWTINTPPTISNRYPPSCSTLSVSSLPFSLIVASCPTDAASLDSTSSLGFLDRLATLIPPPRKHRHRYHGVFAPNHPLRQAVTAMVIGNRPFPPLPLGEGRGEGAPDSSAVVRRTALCQQEPDDVVPSCTHDTSRIARAKLLARGGKAFPLACPNCGGDIRLISIITQPGPIRKILTHLGEPLVPPPVSPARGPPVDWDDLVQAEDDTVFIRPRLKTCR